MNETDATLYRFYHDATIGLIIHKKDDKYYAEIRLEAVCKRKLIYKSKQIEISADIAKRIIKKQLDPFKIVESHTKFTGDCEININKYLQALESVLTLDKQAGYYIYDNDSRLCAYCFKIVDETICVDSDCPDDLSKIKNFVGETEEFI